MRMVKNINENRVIREAKIKMEIDRLREEYDKEDNNPYRQDQITNEISILQQKLKREFNTIY